MLIILGVVGAVVIFAAVLAMAYVVHRINNSRQQSSNHTDSSIVSPDLVLPVLAAFLQGADRNVVENQIKVVQDARARFKTLAKYPDHVEGWRRMHRQLSKAAMRDVLVQEAQSCMLPAGNYGLLPELDGSIRSTLIELCGTNWLEQNTPNLQAMLAFVEEFRMLQDERIKQFAIEDAQEILLLQIASCMTLTDFESQSSRSYGILISAVTSGDAKESLESDSPGYVLFLALELGRLCASKERSAA